ncbi:MAG: DUF4330 domain-containing protein [Candidatus Sericytochromatia bacterium]|nr:DUF4330 domain-containing protein [Candidatus Sericytochromatia bacterium]
MPLIDERGRFLGLFNVIDGLITVAVVGGFIGILAVKNGYSAVHRIALAQGPAEVDLMIRANIKDLSMFKAGDKAFITIRNQPYDKVEIAAVSARRQQIYIPIDDGKNIRLIDDPTNPYASEIILTLRDEGMETEDGIVWGGQKLKLGIPIDVEGFKYRLRGSVIDVRMTGTKQAGRMLAISP